jgi:ATP-binding cassette subfamily B protein
MASTEDPKDERQASSRVRVVNDEFLDTKIIASLPWDIPPLSLLNPEQQVQFRNQAQTTRYTLGKRFGLQIVWESSF